MYKFICIVMPKGQITESKVMYTYNSKNANLSSKILNLHLLTAYECLLLKGEPFPIVSSQNYFLFCPIW